MDIAFLTGLGAVVSALIVFVGSAFLLLTLVMGARLAYFVVASITLCFLLVMGVVWSINKLGPVGQLAQWLPIEAAQDPSQIEKFGPASSYPDDPWHPASKDNQDELTKRAELESEATKYVDQLAGSGKIEGVPQTFDSLTVDTDSSRLLEQGGEVYGAATVVVTSNGEETPIVVVAKFDPGNPLGKARRITAGIFVLLALHLFGLSRVERRARREVQPA
jgi:hypothetical protein